MKDSKIKVFTIPNIITLLNLLSGCIAIVFTFHGELIIASLLIFTGGIFDFLDGMFARLLKSYSELGKQLDSLADVITFGIAPSVIIYKLIFSALEKTDSGFDFNNATILQFIVLFSSFLVAIFSALRLAKFNIDERQTDSFIGIPTPANGFVIASFPFILHHYPMSEKYLLNIYILPVITIILSLLLISEIPLMSLKFKNFNFLYNKERYALLFFSLILIAFLRIAAFPVIFVIYILISLLFKPNKAEI